MFLFILLCKLVITWAKSVDEILNSDHSNTESYWAVRPCEIIFYAVQGGFNIWDWEWHAKAASIFYTAYQTDHNLQG